MILKSLFKDDWTILAVCSNRVRCQVEEFILQIPPNLAKDRDRLVALLERVSEDGPQELPDSISHTIVGSDDIWEFIRGRIRVFWFYDEGRLVVCSNAFIKKKQKTPRKEIDMAEAARKLYFEDKRANRIEIIEE